MNAEQEEYIRIIGRSTDNDILIKKTGWEEIQLQNHAHPKCQIIYTLSGTLHVRIGTTAYFVPEKHIAWIPENTDHELSSSNRQVSLVIFYVKFKKVAKADPKTQFSIYKVNALIGENIRFLASSGTSIRSAESPDLFDYAVSFFKLLPSMCPNTEKLLKMIVIPNDARLRPILEYISMHLHENLQIGQVAEIFGLSVRNLSRLFNASGIHFCNYINNQRIMRAIELASDGEKTLKQVSYEVGFSVPANFNRVFKQITGMSPTEFLKK